MASMCKLRATPQLSRPGEVRRVPAVTTVRIIPERDDEAILKELIAMDGELRDLEFIGRLYTDQRPDDSKVPLFDRGELDKIADLAGMPLFAEHAYPVGEMLPDDDSLIDKSLYEAPGPGSRPMGHIVRSYSNIRPGQLWIRGQFVTAGLSDEKVAKLRRKLRETWIELSIGYGYDDDPAVLARGEGHTYYGPVIRRRCGDYARCVEASVTKRGQVPECTIAMVRASADGDGTGQPPQGTNETNVQTQGNGTGTMTDQATPMQVDSAPAVTTTPPAITSTMTTPAQTATTTPAQTATTTPAQTTTATPAQTTTATPAQTTTTTTTAQTTNDKKDGTTVTQFQMPPHLVQLQDQMRKQMELMEKAYKEAATNAATTATTTAQSQKQLEQQIQQLQQGMSKLTVTPQLNQMQQQLTQLTESLKHQQSDTQLKQIQDTIAAVQKQMEGGQGATPTTTPQAPTPPQIPAAFMETLKAMQEQHNATLKVMEEYKEQQRIAPYLPHAQVVADNNGVSKEYALKMLTTAGPAEAQNMINRAVASAAAVAAVAAAAETAKQQAAEAAKSAAAKAATPKTPAEITKQNLDKINQSTATGEPPAKTARTTEPAGLRAAQQQGTGTATGPTQPVLDKDGHIVLPGITMDKSTQKAQDRLFQTAGDNPNSALAKPDVRASLAYLGVGF